MKGVVSGKGWGRGEGERGGYKVQQIIREVDSQHPLVPIIYPDIYIFKIKTKSLNEILYFLLRSQV